jgi:hypothetical protein
VSTVIGASSHHNKSFFISVSFCNISSCAGLAFAEQQQQQQQQQTATAT